MCLILPVAALGQASRYAGTGGEGHVRMNIATSQAILEEGVRRMASAL